MSAERLAELIATPPALRRADRRRASRPRAASPTSARRPGSGRSSTRWSTHRSDAFRRDPEKVWQFYAPRFDVLTGRRAERGARALAELERRGLVSAVVTQNIDLLHERAGSREVVEVHGSIRTASCPRCGAVACARRSLAADRAAACRDCGACLKPDVVFFGELLPRGGDRPRVRARAAAALLLVVGSSLEVYPVADLPLETLRAGGSLAIVNRGPTAFDEQAELRIDGSAGETLSAVLAAVEGAR